MIFLHFDLTLAAGVPKIRGFSGSHQPDIP